MTQADFYTLKEDSSQARLVFACRLTEKACSQNMPVYLHVDDAATAEELDNLLWSFKPESFIPHAMTDMLDELDGEEVKVIIGYSPECPVPKGLLINLSAEIPAFYKDFERIAEIVINNDEARTVSRQHWSNYKAQDVQLNHHSLG
jgi:DNA polymerase-3 subunit chi